MRAPHRVEKVIGGDKWRLIRVEELFLAKGGLPKLPSKDII